MGRLQRLDDLRKRAEGKVEMLTRKNLAQHLIDVEGKELLHELQVQMVELTMQNEQLMDSQVALEMAKSRYETLYDSAPACYLKLDKTGYIIEGNRTAATVFNVHKEYLSGLSFYKFLTPRSADSFGLFLRNSVPRGENVVLDLRLRTQQDQPIIRISVSISAEYDHMGRLLDYSAVFVDPRWPKR